MFAACCSVFPRVAVKVSTPLPNVSLSDTAFTYALQCVAVLLQYVLQCVAVCCSVLQCVAVCCSVSHIVPHSELALPCAAGYRLILIAGLTNKEGSNVPELLPYFEISSP